MHFNFLLSAATWLPTTQELTVHFPFLSCGFYIYIKPETLLNLVAVSLCLQLSDVSGGYYIAEYDFFLLQSDWKSLKLELTISDASASSDQTRPTLVINVK